MTTDFTEAAGWSSSFPIFHGTARSIIREALKRFVPDADESQLRAWADSVPRLQKEIGEVGERDGRAPSYTAILEYRLPFESRRADAVFLVSGGVVVVELKGKSNPTQADIDQALGYARDLRAYHRDCDGTPTHAVLVPTRSTKAALQKDGVWVVAPEHLDALLLDLSTDGRPALTAHSFLDDAAYRPLPSLVQAARELFHSGTLREVWRARAATDPAVMYISGIAHEAARTGGRHLVLVTGSLELPRFGGRVRTAVDREPRGADVRLVGPRPWTQTGT
jgi:hypothetical protein